VLYGWVQARDGMRRGLPLVVAEGYIDVIAIQKSGVAAAVAPLGTALTVEQIQLLWKLNDEPVLCFDGDAAGQRAQLRALERLLPVLEPGKSARFATLPDGKDPDDVIAAEGPDGFRKIIDMSCSLIDSLWVQMAARFDLRQPESRASFWQSVRGHVRGIANNQVRGAYGDEIESRIAAMRAEMRGLSAAVMPLQRSRRPQTGLIARHRAILALVLAHPALVSSHFEALSMLDLRDEALESLKKALMDAVIREPDLDATALSHHLKGSEFDNILAAVTGDDMKARLPFNPEALTGDKAAAYLDELLQLVGGKSGLFSAGNRPKA
jgi:DNA primase